MILTSVLFNVAAELMWDATSAPSLFPLLSYPPPSISLTHTFVEEHSQLGRSVGAAGTPAAGGGVDMAGRGSAAEIRAGAATGEGGMWLRGGLVRLAAVSDAEHDNDLGPLPSALSLPPCPPPLCSPASMLRPPIATANDEAKQRGVVSAIAPHPQPCSPAAAASLLPRSPADVASSLALAAFLVRWRSRLAPASSLASPRPSASVRLA